MNKELKRLYRILLKHRPSLIGTMGQSVGVTRSVIVFFGDGACVELKPIGRSPAGRGTGLENRRR